MRRHEKASTAQSTDGTGKAGVRRIGRSFATRGASSDANGSGAPSRRSRGLFGLLCLALLGLGALLGGSALPAAADATCPNEALRQQSNVNSATGLPFSAGLPECRAYEKVTPVEKQAHDATLGSYLSSEGTTVGFYIFGQLPEGEGFNYLNGSGNSFLSRRSGAGWGIRTTSVPAVLMQRTSGLPNLLDYSPDFTRAVTCGSVSGSGAGSTSNVACAMRRPDGSWVSSPVYKVINYAASNEGAATYMGASADLSHVLFKMPFSTLKLLPADNYTNGNSSSIYEIAGMGTDTPTLRLVNLDNNGNQLALSSRPLELGGGEFASTGVTYQAISDDGETIYFTGTPVGGTVPTLYARKNGATTVTVSNPSPAECTTCSPTPFEALYQGASADGSQAYFLTKQQLLNADTDSIQDLYLYDFNNSAGHHFVQVSGGGAGDPTPGSGANVAGVVRTSPDGSHAYFVASGVLTTTPNSSGQVATIGAPNLYAFSRDAAHPAGSTKFVGTLLPADSGLWSIVDVRRQARTSPDGDFLVFATKAALTPDDLDASSDVYRYDATSGQLLRLSIGEPGFPASSNGNTPGKEAGVSTIAGYVQNGAMASVNQYANPISDDGSRVIFATNEQLQADDVNNGPDIYLWNEGSVSMISDGRDTSREGAPWETAQTAAISASGDDIVFSTRAQVLGPDTDELLDVYDAKVDGGLPYTPPPPPCVSVEACHGSAAADPTSATPGSATFTGPGNSVPAKKKPKKPKKKHKKQHSKNHSTGKRR